MKYWIISMIIACGIHVSATAAPVKIIQETIEAAAKISGKSLSRASRTAAVATLKKIVSKYGDDVLKVVKNGGLEALQVGKKYGDDFWRLTRGANPSAIRSLVLHADDLMPVAKRLGKDFLILEGKVPGLGAKVVAEFGDDAAIMLAKNASPDDISKILGYAGRADSPATKKVLIETYKKGGGKFLKHLDWKHIASAGLSTAAIVSAYKLSNGIEDGLKTTAEEHPETFKEIVNNLLAPISFGMWLLIAAAIIPLALLTYKYGMKLCRLLKKRECSVEPDGAEEASESETE